MQTLSSERARLARPKRRGFQAVVLRCAAFASALLQVACYATLDGEYEDTGSQSQYGYSSGTGGSGTDNGGSGSGGAPPVDLPLEPIPQETIPYARAKAIIGRSCTTAKCHGRDEEPLITIDDTLPHFLSTTLVEECGNVPLVTPGDDTKSALILLVTRQCGDLVMPDTCRTNPCLLPKDLSTLQAWIRQGAPMQ